MMADRRGHRREVAVHDLDQPLRGHAFAGAGKSLDVAEQHGHDAALAFGRQRRPLDQPFDDARIDIFAKGLAQALLEAQLLDHLVERGRQVTDFVLRGGDERSVEIAGLDRLGALQQPPDRTGHAGADQACEHQTEYGGKHGQDHGDQHHLVLLLHRHVGVLAQQDQHVRSHAVELLLSSSRSSSIRSISSASAFSSPASSTASRRLFSCVEAATGIVVDGVDTGLELTERRCVAERGTLLDQPMDQRARGQDFQFDLPAQRVVAVAERRLLAAVAPATGSFR